MPASPRRKAYGQHFLKDQSVINKITEKVITEYQNNSHIDHLLEIGPGKGALTQPVFDTLFFQSNQKIKKPFLFTIVEKDKKIAHDWTIKTADLKGINVLSQDFLNLKNSDYLAGQSTLVFSNLPYSAGTAILNKLALDSKKIPVMILMFQAEVAARLRANPDTKSWGSLSLWIQNLWDVEKLLFVPPSAFSPRPDVNSEVLIFRARTSPKVQLTDQNLTLWEKLIKTAFLHRRKMLRSSLPKDPLWQDSLIKAGINPTLRAEALNWEDWQRWFEAIILNNNSQSNKMIKSK